MKTLIQSAKLLLLTTLLTGGLYPLLVYAAASFLFPQEKTGSIVYADGKIAGSELIGQSFDKPGYFLSRPSAAGYDAAASAASNYGPTNAKFLSELDARKNRLIERFGQGPVPADLITASGSGLDPHISVAGAYYQAAAIASERRAPPEEIKTLINGRIEGKTLGLLGQPRVNVLLLNLELDRRYGTMR